MGILIHKNKKILPDMKIAKSLFEISKGLMFASSKKIDRGICLCMPSEYDVRFGSSITMMFCFHSMDILFINKKMKVVDKVTLPPWKFNYTPKKAASYVIESSKGKFKTISIGDTVNIIF
jgi:uncharacterized membrane protein (UPF0127 family)